MLKRIGILMVAAVIGVLGLEVGEKMSVPGVSGVISPAHAVIGRPGTPRSVAGDLPAMRNGRLSLLTRYRRHEMRACVL
jgi:hypothetical protein